MVDAQNDPVARLLLHNAMTVIVAVCLSLVFRCRLLNAFISFVVALIATFTMRTVNAVTEIAWWLLVPERASPVYDPIIYDTSWWASGLLETLSFSTVFVSPFVFAYYTAWQWATPSTRRLTRLQVGLHTMLFVTSACCLVSGFCAWLDSQRIAVYPIVIVAICLMVRPLRCWLGITRRLKDNTRLAEIRERLSARAVAAEAVVGIRAEDAAAAVRLRPRTSGRGQRRQMSTGTRGRGRGGVVSSGGARPPPSELGGERNV